MTYKVHLDGYNLLPYVTGQVKESPRNSIMYFSDDGDVIAVRGGATTSSIWRNNAQTR